LDRLTPIPDATDANLRSATDEMMRRCGANDARADGLVVDAFDSVEDAARARRHAPLASPPMTVRIGFLGAGLIATYHGKSLHRSGSDHVIAAVHDPDPERAAAFAAASGARVADTEGALLDAVDAVYVCTWTSEHPRLVSAAVGRGLPVFCEKPLAMSLGAARAMADEVRAAGVVNQVGLVLRSSPAFLELEHQLADPRNGRVQAVVLRDDQFLPVQGLYGSTWRGDVQRAGAGTMLEHSIHDIDALEWLLGPIEAVSARSSTFHDNPGIEDTVVAALGFASGAQGTLTSVWHQLLERPSLRRLEVICERAFLTVEHDVTGPVTWTRPDGEHGSLEGEALVAAVTERHGGRYPNQDRGFVEAVASGVPGPHPDLQTALRAHEVVDAVYRSASAGGASAAP
jgi:predicted dehydrogenase